MPFAILAGVAFLALLIIPQMWVLTVIRRHGKDRPDFPGTGAEFARHILDGMKLTDVKVEETNEGDHYSLLAKAVRLTPNHYYGRSLSAVVIAAHEVGHAMQDATDYAPLKQRVHYSSIASYLQTIGNVCLVASPVISVIVHHAAGLAVGIGAYILVNLTAVILTVSTLPVEYDASFNRALPVLREGRYISDGDMKAARHILNAAALTYVASALISIVNVVRWFRR